MADKQTDRHDCPYPSVKDCPMPPPMVTGQEYFYLDQKMDKLRIELSDKIDNSVLEIRGQVTRALEAVNQTKGSGDLTRWAIPVFITIIQILVAIKQIYH